MPEYDFKSLSSYEFELLVRDLLQEQYKVRLESFKSGRDQGIDLRYAVDSKNTLIVQCKHYAESGYQSLYRHLKTEELAKVNQLDPQQYVLATSVNLTPTQKNNLLGLLSPYCKSSGDIIGGNELNGLLAVFPQIEKRHYKLWLTSINVLETVLHSRVFNQSLWEVESLEEHLKRYVVNDSLHIAQGILDKHNTCIIAGLPGIGKTTLARVLIVDFASRGYEVVKVSEDIREAWDVYKPTTLQVFYYDDFLGQSSLDAKLGKNEEDSLLKFMAAVQKSKNTKLIMTTRDYILNQAKQLYAKIEQTSFDPYMCVIDLQQYTKVQRARILFNHLYFSDLPFKFKAELLRDRRYRDVVMHKNYSPRIIESMTDVIMLGAISSENYFSEFLSNLNNPSRLWERIFENDLSQAARNLLLVLSSMPHEVLLDDLEVAFQAYATYLSDRYSLSTAPTDFRRALKELESNFIYIQRYGRTTVVGFHNGSVRDFLDRYVAERPLLAIGILESAVYSYQCSHLWGNEIGGYRTEIRKAVAGTPALFEQALLRTFECPSCSVANTVDKQGRTTGKVRCHESREYDIRYAKKALAGLSTNSASVITKMLQRLVSLYSEGEGDKDALLSLLNGLDQSDFVAGELSMDDFLAAAKRFIMQDMLTGNLWFEDFSALAAFERSFPSMISDEERAFVREQFEECYPDEVGELVGKEVSHSELSSRIDTLRNVADWFCVDIDHDLRELLEWEEEVGWREDYAADMEYESYRDSRGEEGRQADAIIDTIFSAPL